MVVRIARARTVVEIGTSNGYSTIWLADAVGDTGGAVVSVDTASLDEARNNLASADTVQPGLATRVEFRQDDGGAYLARLADGTVVRWQRGRCSKELLVTGRSSWSSTICNGPNRRCWT